MGVGVKERECGQGCCSDTTRSNRGSREFTFYEKFPSTALVNILFLLLPSLSCLSPCSEQAYSQEGRQEQRAPFAMCLLYVLFCVL